MKHRPSSAVLSALLAMAVAVLACAGGGAAATVVPTARPTVAAPTQAPTQAPTAAPTTAAPTTAPTQAPQATATEAATTAAPTESAQATPTQAALSGSLDVHGVSAYLDALKYFHIVGLLTNGTDKAVKNVALTVELADAGGKSVLKDDSGSPTTTLTINTLLSTLDSGETSPFEYSFDAGDTDTSGWKPKVTFGSNEAPAELHRVAIDIANDQTTVNSDGDIYLTGELVNKSDKPAQINDFAGAVLVSTGDVAGASAANFVARILAPAGDSEALDRTPFVIHINGPVKQGAAPKYYIDAVEANPSDLTAAGDLHLALNASYVDSNNGVHVIATITNSGTNTVTAQAVAGLYDQAGKVLDASSVSTPFDLIPGGSSPAIFYYFGNVDNNPDLINKVVSTTAQLDPYWTFSVSRDVVTLEATGVTTSTDGSQVTVKGNIANTSKISINTPTVIILAKDADGKIVAGDWTGADGTGPFAPGKKTTFSQAVDLPAKVDPTTLQYVVLVQAEGSQ